jgi:hypothetical protein
VTDRGGLRRIEKDENERRRDDLLIKDIDQAGKAADQKRKARN